MTASRDRAAALLQTFPTAHHLREKARSRMPRFAFEFMDGGAGLDGNIRRNWDALDAVELMPRYCVTISPPPADVTLFGKPYSAPLGIAPIGSPSTVLPGAEHHLARAAQRARTPFALGVLSNLRLEEAAEIAPDVLWYQLYRFAKDDHRIGFDLVRRAQAVGVQTLILTVDTPIRTVRTREVRAGIVSPFRMSARLLVDALRAPAWLLALARHGAPRFAALDRYFPRPDMNNHDVSVFLRSEMVGAFTWDEVARYRELWKGPLVLKGVLHPADAQRAAALGVDGLMVTNHGGRQIEALPASIDALPAVRAAVCDRMTIFLDSGIRSGVDVARAIACGADAAFAGKSFLWSLGALSEEGPEHLIRLYTDELRATLGQLGCDSVRDLRHVETRHAAAWALTGSQRAD